MEVSTGLGREGGRASPPEEQEVDMRIDRRTRPGIQTSSRRPPRASAVEAAIARQLARDAARNGSSISVAVDGHRVVLSGHVSNTAARGTAEDTAWQIPGVEAVDNEIIAE
jgi:osmotically-inducible protein OsmY